MKNDSPVRKVIVISAVWPPAPGAHTDYLAALCRDLVDSGDEVEVMTTRGQVAQPSGMIVRAELPSWGWASLRRLTRLMTDARPDVIVLAYPGQLFNAKPMVTVLPAVARRFCPGAPFVTVLAGNHVQRSSLLLGALRLLFRRSDSTNRSNELGFLISHSDIVTLPTEADRAAFVRRFPERRSRFMVLPVPAPPPPAASQTADKRSADTAQDVGSKRTDYQLGTVLDSAVSSRREAPRTYFSVDLELEDKTVEASAREVLPLVFDLVRPRSVVDVGCWRASWLRVALDLGANDILGIDVDATDRSELKIPVESFLPFDLTQPFRLEREFDLVISLEVAEHLPDASADGFVDTLTSLGPVVLFSAAIPQQEGDSHLNEQWPSYWIERFAARGWQVSDCLRAQVWDNPRVAPWYAQNLLLFTDPGWSARRPLTSRRSEPVDFGALPVVHPGVFRHSVELASCQPPPPQPSLRQLVWMLPSALRNAVSNRLTSSSPPRTPPR